MLSGQNLGQGGARRHGALEAGAQLQKGGALRCLGWGAAGSSVWKPQSWAASNLLCALGVVPCPSLSFLICKVECQLTTSLYQGCPLLIGGIVTFIQGYSLRREGVLPSFHTGGTPSQRHPQTHRDSCWMHSLLHGGQAGEKLGSWLGRALV